MLERIILKYAFWEIAMYSPLTSFRITMIAFLAGAYWELCQALVFGEDHHAFWIALCLVASFVLVRRWRVISPIEPLLLALTVTAVLLLDSPAKAEWFLMPRSVILMIALCALMPPTIQTIRAKYFAQSAVLEWNRGQHEKAELLLRRALSQAVQALGVNHPFVLAWTGNLAKTCIEQGKLKEAQQLSMELVDKRRRGLGSEHPNTLAAMKDLAIACRGQGMYEEAEHLLARTVEVQTRSFGAEHSDTLESLDELAEVYEAQGRYKEASALYIRILGIRERIFGRDHARTLASLSDLALLSEKMGIDEEAEGLFDVVLQRIGKLIQESPGSLEQEDLLTLVLNWAGFSIRRGSNELAELLYKVVLKACVRLNGLEHPATTTAMSNLAQLYMQQGRYEEGGPLAGMAVAASRRLFGDANPQTVTLLVNLAVMFEAAGRPAKAFESLEQALGGETSVLMRRLSISSAEQATIAIDQARGTFYAFLSLVWREFQDSASHVRVAADMVIRRKAIGLEAAASQRAALLSGRYPLLEPQIRELTGWRMQVARKTLSGPAAGESPERHRQALEEWSVKLERLERELARKIPELGLEERLRTIDRNVVALALPEGSALVEFLRFDVFDFRPVAGDKQWKPARYLAFVLEAGQGDTVRMVDLGDAEPIDAMVRTFRRGVEMETAGRQIPDGPLSTGREWWQVSDGLRVALLDSVLTRKQEEPVRVPSVQNKRLFLATDGELNLLPFEALRTQWGKFLIDEYEISYLGTGRDILRYRQTTEVVAGEPVVAADPAFALPGTSNIDSPTRSGFRGEMEREGIGFPPLPGTRLEGERIGRRLGVTPWMSDQVLEGKLKRLRSPGVLHVATHGYFLSDQDTPPADWHQPLEMRDGPSRRLGAESLTNPMLRSGLALAGSQNWLEHKPAPEEAEDGLLTAEDLAAMDLRGTEMAVLSACDTGMGELRHGEGVFGLRRGFLLAGVKTLVMSLWKIDDLAAVLLMDRFYENLLGRRMGRSEALREAQRYLRRDITVGGIRAEWLNEEMVRKLAIGNPQTRRRLEGWRDGPDEVRPFREVFYWAPFILHGETGPLQTFSSD
jgi:CHAT domain-containing protein/tetratricopeptide (TPR) repeat protein